MEFWDGRERNAAQCTKYRTLPGWSFSAHVYPSKTPTAPFPEPRSKNQGWMGEPSSWSVPGSRTGGTIRDWTDPIPSSNFSYENQLYPQETATYAGQESSFDRQRALIERHREKERLAQRAESTNKWQTLSSALYRREKEKLSANSFRELEAWANRYYHSLPRQRQCVPDSERRSASTSGLASAQANQRPLAKTLEPYNQEKCNLGNRLRVQQEVWKRQQPPYVPAKQSLSRTTPCSNSKENVILSPSFNQPPNYTPPPPYSTPPESDVLLKLGKSPPEPVMEYTVQSRPVASMFSTRTQRSLVPVTEGGQDHSSTDRIQRSITYPDTNSQIPRPPQKPLNKLAEPITVPQPIQKQEAVTQQLQSSHPVPEKSQTSYSDTTLTRQNKPKRRRGGETVFCLVSRMGELAGLSSSPDEPLKSHSLSLLKVPAPGGTADVAKQTNESLEPVQLPDEVDSGGLTKESIKLDDTPEGHTGKSQTSDQSLRDDQKERLRKDIQKKLLTMNTEEDPGVSNKRDENLDPCASTKTGTETLGPPQNQATVKFPLWREPKWHYCSKGALEKNDEPNQDISSDGQTEQDVDGQARKAKALNSATRDKNRGLVVIDATCVVVKVEFIFPPEKEHVQYVCSRSTDSYERDSLNLQVQNNDRTDTNTTDTTDTTDTTEKSRLTNSAQELVQEQRGDDLMDRSSGVISENETLRERAERILGITLQNSSNEGQTQDPQSTTTENSNVPKSQGSYLKEPEGSPEVQVDHVEDSECHLECVTIPENVKTPVEEILTVPKEEEAKSLTTNADGTLEESGVIIVDAVQVLDIVKQESEGTAGDILEESFTTMHTAARVETAIDTTTHELKDSFEDTVIGGPTNQIHEIKNLLPAVLDDHVEKTSTSFGQEGEDTPSSETGDVDNLCPTLFVDFIQDSSKIEFGEERTLIEGNFSDIQNMCQALLGDHVEHISEYFGPGSNPKEGSSSCETSDVCPVLPDNYMENINESFGQEGSSRELSPLEAMDGVNNICPPFLKNDTEDSGELLLQEGTPNLSNNSDDIKNLCIPLLGDCVENTDELFCREGTHDEDNLPSHKHSVLHSSVENTSQEGGSTEDNPSNETEEIVENLKEPFGTEGAPREDNLSGNNIENLCPTSHDNCMEYLTDRTTDSKISDETDDTQNLSPSLLHLSMDGTTELDSPGEGTLSTETHNINNLCVVLPRNTVENTGEPFGGEDAPKNGNISAEPDSTDNLSPSLLHSSVESTSELFEEEDSPWEDTSSTETQDINNLCPALPHNNVEQTSEPLGREDALQEVNFLCETGGTDDLGSFLLRSSVERTSELFENEGSPWEDTSSTETEDINNLCPVLAHDAVENTCEHKEGTFLDETDSTDHLPGSLLCSSLESTSEKFEQEGSPYWKDTPSVETDDVNNLCPVSPHGNIIKTSEPSGKEDGPSEDKFLDNTDGPENLCPTFPHSSMENPSDLFDQGSRPRQGTASNEASDTNSPCSHLFGDNTIELFDQEGKEDISPCPLTLECLPSLSESPCDLDKSILLSLPPSCLVSHSELQPEASPPDVTQASVSASCVGSTFPSPLLTPVCLAHLRPSASSSQTSSFHGEVCSPSSSTPPKFTKEKQYPKSLWDAVSRIRKHTAPDSENEEEEGVELWEQLENSNVDTELQGRESIQERAGNIMENHGNMEIIEKDDARDVPAASDVVDRTTQENIPLKEEGRLGEVMRTAIPSEERDERKDGGQAEDDTLSSSSLDSHDSNDTVIEGEANEMFKEEQEEADHEEFYSVGRNEGNV